MNAEKLVFVGREAEIRSIGERLDEAAAGRGSSVNVRGEPGIGKSVLVEQCAAMARSKGFRVLMGGAAQSGSEPFQVFNRALCGLTDGPLLSGMETASFAGVFFVGRSGDVIAQAVGRDIDPAAIAATMGAVQSFIGDSFRVADGSMGRMTFGTTTVLAEGDQSGMLFGVVLGPEHREMASCISEAAAEIRRGAKAPSETVSGLAAKRFAIRRSPSNMKLSSELNMLADKTLAVIQNATGDSPVLMVFEDMHWADEVSSHVFSYLARISGRLRLLILATSRPGESAEWDGSADAMRQDGVLSVMPLMKLETALVKSLVESRCGPNDFPDEFHERLSRDCDGNPLFIHEVISQMLSDGGIALQGGMHRLSATDFSLPGKVEDLVMGRVSALASPTMALVEMLSCAGKEFPADIADALASSKGASNGMEELAAAGIVEAGEGGFQFRHALFRDAIYKNISPRWKSSHHKAIGEYYEAACGADVAGVIYELARHFHLSNEKRKAVGYCIWAGEAAEAAYAAEKAIEFYGWAQADISAMGASAEDARLQTDLLERAGDMQVLISRYPDAMASFAAAISKVEDRRAKARLHRKTGDVLFRLGDFAGCLDETSKGEAQTDDLEELLLLGFQRAYMLMRQGEYDRSIAMCNDLLERASAFPLSEKITASIFDTLGTNSHRKGDYETALMWYNRSLEMSERAGDLRKMGALYNNIGNVYGDRLLNETSREYYDKAMAIFRKIGDKQAFCVIQGNIGAIHHSMGQVSAAMDCYMKAMKVAEEIGDLRMVSANLGNLGVTQFTLGQFAQTIETFERAMSMWERMSDQNSECWGLSSIGASHFEMGEYGKAQDFIMRSIELSEKIDDQWKLCGALIYMSELARMAGRLAEAAEHYARTLSIAEKLESVDFAVDAEAGLAETSIATGDLPGAEKLAAHAVLKAKEGGLRVELANALRVHGLALSGLGEAREAERRFVEALEIHAGIENRVGKAKLLYALGWTRMARGEGHGGRSEVESARATFSECGMRRWAEMCDSVLSSSA